MKKRSQQQHPNNTYLVMELCQFNLKEFVDKLEKSGRSLKEWEIGHIMKQVVEATAYMHDEKIIHR